MNILQAIKERHSVRKYTDREIEREKIEELLEEVKICNEKSGLNIQLITNEKDAFSGFVAKYSRFENVKNYFAIVGDEKKDLDEIAGYFGEKLVLKAQMIGLNTCWVGLKFITKYGKCVVEKDEKIICLIALGYGVDGGRSRKSKTFEQVTKIKTENTEVLTWFKDGIDAVLLAPTAINQQKFLFTLYDNNKVKAEITGGFMSKIDLGIAKYHFEVVVGEDNFEWI